MEDKEKYIGLTKSLDSIRDVALAEIRLIESEEERTKFADFVTERAKLLLSDIADKRRQKWWEMNDAQSKKFQQHAQELLLNPSTACPPGFREENGICVPI
jgi:hypothetical protein